MKSWPRRIRGAVGMGLTWAAGWALVVVLMGVTTILLPGTGLEVIFEAADDELSLPEFAAWGAIGGLCCSLTSLRFCCAANVDYERGTREPEV